MIIDNITVDVSGGFLHLDIDGITATLTPAESAALAGYLMAFGDMHND